MSNCVPVVSICIAIYNRLAPFKYTFESLLKNIKDYDSFFEVVVSVNPSEDGNRQVIEYVESMAFEYHFLYRVNDRNIGGEANILNAVHYARGKYIWIVGDDDLILPETYEIIRTALQQHQDISWIFLNTSRVGGRIEDFGSKIISVKVDNLKSGYYKNAKHQAILLHKQIDAALLFSSSNIFLRNSMLLIEKQQNEKSDCNQLASIFHSASVGGAYIVDEPCLIAGGLTTWSDREDYFLGVHYNRDLMYAVGNGYTKKEMVHLINYRMRNDALRSWFVIYRMIIRRNPMGIVAMKELFSIIPLETILIFFFSPLLAVFLILRHQVRNFKRRQIINNYKSLPNARKEILERL